MVLYDIHEITLRIIAYGLTSLNPVRVTSRTRTTRKEVLALLSYVAIQALRIKVIVRIAQVTLL